MGFVQEETPLGNVSGALLGGGTTPLPCQAVPHFPLPQKPTVPNSPVWDLLQTAEACAVGGSWARSQGTAGSWAVGPV